MVFFVISVYAVKSIVSFVGDFLENILAHEFTPSPLTKAMEIQGSARTGCIVAADAREAHTEATNSESDTRSNQRSFALFMPLLYLVTLHA